MIITLSPAKILDFKSAVPLQKGYKPMFLEEAEELNAILKAMNLEDIADLMKISLELAQETLSNIHFFNKDNVRQRQAIFVYNGIAFQGLDPKTLIEEELFFAQKHLLLLSGLYGMLRPLDEIKPYRLEMQAKLKNNKGNNLYDFWKEKLSYKMAEILENDDKIWIDLSSKEYSKAINRNLLPGGTKIITPTFKEKVGNEYKQVTVHAKKARGMMARFIIQNQLTDMEHLKAFNSEGYIYSEQLSSEKEWTFVR